MGIAQHLAQAFRNLETRLKLLSNDEKVGCVQHLLAQLRMQLNTSEECFVTVDASNCICFRARRRGPELPAAPQPSQVPIPLVNLQERLVLPRGEGPESWASFAKLPYTPDLSLLHIIPFVDGIRSVGDIARASSLDDKRVLICMQHLLHFGLVAFIDAIELNNQYCLLPEFHTAFSEPAIRDIAVRYVTAGECNGNSHELVEGIQALYAQVDGWKQTLGEFQEAHAQELQRQKVSLRHFVTFGLLQGFLQRIYGHEALNQTYLMELQLLRSAIPGMNIQEANRHPQIRSMVARMKELRANA